MAVNPAQKFRFFRAVSLTSTKVQVGQVAEEFGISHFEAGHCCFKEIIRDTTAEMIALGFDSLRTMPVGSGEESSRDQERQPARLAVNEVMAEKCFKFTQPDESKKNRKALREERYVTSSNCYEGCSISNKSEY